MMQKLLRNVWAWAPPFILMCIIFFLSSRQKISVSEDLDTNFLIFKTLHVAEYATLMLVTVRGFILTTKLKSREIIILSALIAILYGISDEIHQTYVPTRTGKVHDVLVDSIGICSVFIFSSKYFDTLKKYVT